MMILLTGTNDSGKSSCAEKIAASISARRFYAATMIPFGKTGEEIVARHRRQRDGLNFITVECPFDLSDVPCQSGDLVLVEDASNLLANLIFVKHDAEAELHVFEQTRRLRARCSSLLIVAIDGQDKDAYDGETRDYIQSMESLNLRLAETADTHIAMREHLPHVIKGDLQWQF